MGEYQFNVREDREQMKLDRTAGLLDQSRMQAANLKSQASQGFGQAFGALGGVVAGQAASAEGFKNIFGSG